MVITLLSYLFDTTNLFIHIRYADEKIYYIHAFIGANLGLEKSNIESLFIIDSNTIEDAKKYCFAKYFY